MNKFSKIDHLLLFFFLFIYTSIPVFSQKKQTVGLVLSGGGAKGVAHIGVLKAIEEQNIPIDYIVGTSMGAIIGAMYASGYSADEIEKMAINPDFQEWVVGKIPREHTYFYTKPESTPSLLKIDMALDSSFKSKLAPRLLKDISLNFVLSELTAQATQVADYDFDKLMVPFIAMGSDIFTQKELQIRKGTLSNALRTSMTVPFVYRPVKIDDRYYFDGGVYNNFPVDVCRNAFAPDVIIGVNLSAKTFDTYPEEIDDDLIINALMYSMLDNSDASQLKPTDIYVSPNLKPFSALDFSKVKAMIDSGYVSTKRHLDEFNSKIKSKLTSQSLLTKREEFNSRKKELKFSSIKKLGYDTNEKRFIKNIFRKKVKSTHSIEELRKGFYKLVSHKYFHNSFPNMVWNEDQDNFELELSSQKNNYFTINAGGNLSYGVSSTLFLGLEISHFNKSLMQHELNFYAGRFYNSVYEKTHIYLPNLNKYNLGIGIVINDWDYIQTNSFLQPSDSSSALLRQNDQTINLSLIRSLGTHNKLELYSNYFWQNSRYAATQNYHLRDTLDKINQYGFKFGAEIKSNTLNSDTYPTKGIKYKLDFSFFDVKDRYYPGTISSGLQEFSRKSNWLTLKFRGEKYHKFSKHYSLGFLIDGAVSNQGFLANYYGTLINSPTFHPYEDSKFLFLKNHRAPVYLAGGIKNVFTFYKSKMQLRLDAFVFSPFKEVKEEAKLNEDFKLDPFKKFLISGGASLVYESPIGPLSFNYRYYNEQNNFNNFFITFGYYFFNKKPIE